MFVCLCVCVFACMCVPRCVPSARWFAASEGVVAGLCEQQETLGPSRHHMHAKRISVGRFDMVDAANLGPLSPGGVPGDDPDGHFVQQSSFSA